MALILKDLLSIQSSDGSYAQFQDLTGTYSLYSNPGGYGSPNPSGGYSRIKIATKTSIESATTPAGTYFTQYKEYIRTGGGKILVDSKYVSVGEYFVPQTATVVIAGGDESNWLETGYIVYPFLFEPDGTDTAQQIVPGNIGQSNATIDDDVYCVEYQVYAAPDKVGASATSGVTYLVWGSSTDTITYVDADGTNTFRGGEIFTASNTATITSATGTPAVYALNSALSSFAVLTYNLEYDMLTLFSTIPPSAMDELYKIVARLAALKQAAYTSNVSLTDAGNMLADLQARVSQLQAMYS